MTDQTWLDSYDRSAADVDGCESPVTAMSAQAIEAAERAAEGVRAANHASLHRDDFDHQDLYRLMGEVSTLVQRLPQLLDEAGDILIGLHAAGRIDVDHGSLADIVATWSDATASSVSTATELVEQVNRAFAQLSAVKANSAGQRPE